MATVRSSLSPLMSKAYNGLPYPTIALKRLVNCIVGLQILMGGVVVGH